MGSDCISSWSLLIFLLYFVGSWSLSFNFFFWWYTDWVRERLLCLPRFYVTVVLFISHRDHLIGEDGDLIAVSLSVHILLFHFFFSLSSLLGVDEELWCLIMTLPVGRFILFWNKNYKNLWWLWGADWKFRHEGNCLASRGSPSDTEQLPVWRNFQFAPKNHYGLFSWHTLPSTIAFRLEYVLFYQFYAKITTFFYQEPFDTAPLLYVDVETTGGNWHENDVKTSKRQNRHTDVMHESRLTPFM